MNEPKLCPVCKGKQKMPRKFYEPDPGRWMVTPSTIGEPMVPCRSCGGTGYIIVAVNDLPTSRIVDE